MSDLPDPPDMIDSLTRPDSDVLGSNIPASGVIGPTVANAVDG